MTMKILTKVKAMIVNRINVEVVAWETTIHELVKEIEADITAELKGKFGGIPFSGIDK